jgi:hypothetical protein
MLGCIRRSFRSMDPSKKLERSETSGVYIREIVCLGFIATPEEENISSGIEGTGL